MQQKRLLILILALAFLVACAEMLTADFDLVYGPSVDRPLEKQVGAPVPIFVEPVVDARVDRKHIGVFLDSLMKPSSYTVTKDNPATWAEDAIRSELAKAGYALVATEAAASGGIVLEPELRELWCASTTIAGARDITAKVVIRYQAKGSGAVSSEIVAVGETSGHEKKFISHCELDMQLLSNALRDTIVQAAQMMYEMEPATP